MAHRRPGTHLRPVFIELILPVAVPGVFTYFVPPELRERAGIGRRVVAPFGQGRKLYSGIVRRTDVRDPGLKRIKAILSVLDEAPVVTEKQLALWDSISGHYMCTLGEVMLAALPGALVLSSETRIVAAGDERPAWTGNARQDVLLDALEQRHELSMADVGELLALKDPMPVIKKMLEQGTLMIAEEIGEKFTPRMDRFVRLTEAASSEEALHAWFDRLEKAPKLLGLLMKYVEASNRFGDGPREVKREVLLRASGTTAAHLNKLVEKELFEVYERPAGVPPPGAVGRAKELSAPQCAALDHVRAALADLRARFGESVGVCHSRLPPRARTDLWLAMLRDPAAHPLIVGARSALLLPFNDLGLVVVDEEHDPSYKQHGHAQHGELLQRAGGPLRAGGTPGAPR